MFDWPIPIVHDPPRIPVGWRPGTGCVIVAILTPVMFVAMCAALIVLLIWQEDQHHGHVPREAKPAGFRQLARWDSCGATGEWCAEVVILGANGRSFEDTAREIETRYREKGWTVTGSATRDGSLYISDRGKETCITLSSFTPPKSVRDIGGPDAPTLAALVEPYATTVKVVASDCV